MDSYIVVISFISGLIGLVFAGFLAVRVLKQPDGNEAMKEIARHVREGAMAYLRRQYLGVAIFFAIVFSLLLLLSWRGYFTQFVPYAFLIGGFFSALAGFIGMAIATRTSSRTAQAARTSLNSALQVALAGGSVMGFTVVSLGILYASGWFFVLYSFFSQSMTESESILEALGQTILPFGIGASAQALFARVGGGIYTKAADVGADLVGKVEAGIPEDDPRNPATIADNVGDCVGDVAGMGADLFESFVGAILATMALSVGAKVGLPGMLLPLGICAVGIFSSIFGFFMVKTKEDTDMHVLIKALRRGVISSSILVVILIFGLVYFVLGPDYLGIFWAIVIGLVAGILISFSTEYYTAHSFKPTLSIVKSAETGPATVIISGIAVGMLSTAYPVIIIGATIFGSFYVAGGGSEFAMGLYGVGLAAVGMLSTLAITLATDAYGPIADNAGGNAQMAGLPPEVREKTDALDSLGNTTAATGKGFAIGSAALTALAMIVAYRELIIALGGSLDLSITNPKLIVGMFFGGMLPFVFCALTMQAVGRAAQGVVTEVRRQFREIKGLLEGQPGVQADHARCVRIVTASAQKEMVAPALLAIFAPGVVGFLLGPEAAMGLLMGALVTGFVLAIMMANAGGAWDNAKKYIEAGAQGGKGSDSHKASVVGDTVGDPFKDTSGPSLNILIKLMSMVSIVLASFILKNSLM